MALYEKLLALLERFIFLFILRYDTLYIQRAKSVLKASEEVEQAVNKVEKMTRDEKVKLAVSDD